MRGRTKLSGAAALGVLLLVTFPSSAAAAAGDLDATFGGDGKVKTNLTQRYDYAVGLVVQTDGKLVAAGPASGGGGRFALVRYNTNGTLDATFSADGKAFANFTPDLDAAYDLILQPDGKLVAVGSARNGRIFALARFNADGTPDTAFGGDGEVTTNFTTGADFAFGAALQGDKIVAVGRAGGGGGRIAAARYNADGSLDANFGGDGKVTTNFTTGDDRADHVALQSDGKIVVAGTAGYFSGNAHFALVRYNDDGTLDTTFSADGKRTTNFTSGFDGAFALAVLPSNQQIVAVGQARAEIGLALYGTDGTLDTGFGGDGKVTTNFTPGLDYADDVALDADGKIIVAGAAHFFGSDPKFALARYGSDGTLDSSFAGNGKVTTNFTSGFDGAFDVEVQPADGKIVAAGAAGNGGAKFALARYLAN